VRLGALADKLPGAGRQPPRLPIRGRPVPCETSAGRASWEKKGTSQHGAAAMTLFMTLAFIVVFAVGTLPVSGLSLGR
jgi:hypothetical protein